MTDEQLEARFKELEEHGQACATVAMTSATELVFAAFSLLILKGVCTPLELTNLLGVLSEDAKPLAEDSDEAKLGKEWFQKSVALLHHRLAGIEAVREISSNSPTLQ